MEDGWLVEEKEKISIGFSDGQGRQSRRNYLMFRQRNPDSLNLFAVRRSCTSKKFSEVKWKKAAWGAVSVERRRVETR